MSRPPGQVLWSRRATLSVLWSVTIGVRAIAMRVRRIAQQVCASVGAQRRCLCRCRHLSQRQSLLLHQHQVTHTNASTISVWHHLVAPLWTSARRCASLRLRQCRLRFHRQRLLPRQDHCVANSGMVIGRIGATRMKTSHGGTTILLDIAMQVASSKSHFLKKQPLTILSVMRSLR